MSTIRRRIGAPADDGRAHRRGLKQERLAVRINPDQKQLLLRAADLEGRSLSALVLEGARQYAEKIIEEHTVIRLSTRDSETFMEALLNPTAPSARLQAAAKRYKREVREQ